PISTEKEEHEEITTEPIKAGNKANKEPIDIYALQAELDTRKASMFTDSGDKPEYDRDLTLEETERMDGAMRAILAGDNTDADSNMV
ncbi:hypothetical protein, partial [Bacteroides acidifaciens]|uniref:hypothetical protein n=1 Tax=Bacteroides acidifaciens TaxID=85831 RepID=UPI00248C5987